MLPLNNHCVNNEDFFIANEKIGLITITFDSNEEIMKLAF